MRYTFKTQHIAIAVLSMVGMRGVCNASSPRSTDKSVQHPEGAFGHRCDAAVYRSNNLWVSGDLLIWNVCEDGFSCEFGDTTINTTIVNNRPTTAISEHDKDIDFEWRPGFRLGIGMDLPRSGWDAAGYWTKFNAKGHGHSHHNHANWWLHFDVADAVFGRKFWVGSCVSLKPFAGLRYAQIKQGLRTRLEIDIIAATGQSVAIAKRKDKQKFWGVGPELGLEANLYIGNRWSIYGDLGGAILYGHVETKFDNIDSFTLADSSCKAKSESCSNQMVLDVGLGIRREFKHCTLQGGLEHHNYFNYNHIGCCGNLNLYGANFSVIIHF